MVMVFAAVSLAGWTMLRAGQRAARCGRSAAALVVVFGIVFTATRVHLGSFDNELRFRGDSHASLERVLRRPARRRRRCAAARSPCPTTSSIPDVRWILDAGERDVLARSDDSTRSRAQPPRRRDLRRRPRGALASGARRGRRRPAGLPPAARLRRAWRRPSTTPPMSAVEEREAGAARPRAQRRRRRCACPATLPRRSAAAPGRSRSRSCCSRGARPARSGASATACPTPTTPTRTRTSSPARSACSGTAGTRTTSSTRPPTRTCCTSCSRVWFGGREGVSDAFAADPTRDLRHRARHGGRPRDARASGCSYLAGARLFDRRVGLLAAGALAVAFLPVFYSKLALNDVPTLAPSCLALWGVGRRPAPRPDGDYVIAGLGLGLACATKYTGGHRAAAAPRRGGVLRRARPRGDRSCASRWRGAARAGRLLAANPYALLDFAAFRDGLQHQSDASGDAPASSASTRTTASPTTCGRFAWGLGWVPLALAVAGLGLSFAATAARSPCSSPRRCCSWPSWAPRSATSGAG